MGEKSTHHQLFMSLRFKILSRSWKLAMSILLLTIQMSVVRSSEAFLPDGGTPSSLSPWEDYDVPEEPRDFMNSLPNSKESLEEMDRDEDEEGRLPLFLNTPLPPLLMKMKRHLGALAATSGRRLPPQGLELRASAMGYLGNGIKSIIPHYALKREGPRPVFQFLIPRPYIPRPGKRPLLSSKHQPSINSNGLLLQRDDQDEDENGDGDEHGDDKSKNDEMSAFRGKRFMGSMARGGWFPRQFRGYVSSGSQWDKRHVGAVARLGWMPHSKFNRQNELNYKRNLASLRKSQIWIPKGEELQQLRQNIN